MAKREREEEFEVSEVAHSSSSANIKGVVKTLSPMKKKQELLLLIFAGEISDGNLCSLSLASLLLQSLALSIVSTVLLYNDLYQ